MKYKPTKEEIEALENKGWNHDEGWWWENEKLGYGKTYKEAIKYQKLKESKPLNLKYKGEE